MATNYLKPQEPLKKIDGDTGDINYFYPLVTDDQVIMEDGKRLNTLLSENIIYYDAEGNIYSDIDKTVVIEPKTKVSAVSDENGVGLDALLDGIEADMTVVQATVDNAMPKSGDTFTGDVVAYSTNRATTCLRNGEVRITDTTGELQSTDKIIYVRK